MNERLKSFKLASYMLAVMLLLCAFGACSAESITGVVTSNASPVVGGTVTLGEASVTTDTNGAYQFTDVVAGTNVVLRASADGCYAQKKYRAVATGGDVVNFDLTAVGLNIVTNPGFDDNIAPTSYPGVPDGWYTNNSGFYVKESFWAGFFASYYHSGEEAASLMGDTTGGEEGILYQDIPVNPSTDYTAGVWVRSDGQESSVWGTSQDQVAALYIQELDMYGQPTIPARAVMLTQTRAWEYLTTGPITTANNTRIIRIGAYAYMVDDYTYNWGHATFDDFSLDGVLGDPVPSFSGHVMSGSTPLAGATITVDGSTATATTDEFGYYELYGVTGNNKNVRAAIDGYFPVRKLANSMSLVDFDLAAIGANIVKNSGFEDDKLPWAWDWGMAAQAAESWNLNYTWDHAIQGTWLDATDFNSGVQSIKLIVPDDAIANHTVLLFQCIGVAPSTYYSANAWAKAHGWSDPNLSAGLYVKEFDVNGVELADHSVMLTDFVNGQNLATGDFETNANTAFIKVGGVYNSTIGSWFGVAVAFDDIALYGSEVIRPSFTGVVTCGATPVEGATVTVVGKTATATTDANGYYEIYDAAGTGLNLRVAKDGYFPMRKTVDAPSTVNFDVVAVGNNLIKHAGFDDTPLPWSWIDNAGSQSVEFWNLNQTWNYCIYGTWTGATDYKSGDRSIMIMNPHEGQLPHNVLISQTIPVLPGSDYSASVWALAKGGTTWNDPNQSGGLYVKELDAFGNVVASHSVTLTDFANWQHLATGVFTTAGNTDSIQVGGYANFVVGTWETDNALVLDDFELLGDAQPPFAIKGFVMDGATPIEGATVTAGGASATTLVDGSYTIYGITGSGLTVRAAKDGYYPMKKVSGTLPCYMYYDLVPTNMVAHAGFDDITSSYAYNSGVADWNISPNWEYVNYGTAWAAGDFKSGEMSLKIINPSGPADVLLSQTIAVNPSSKYEASVWAHAKTDTWTTDPNQFGGLSVKELDANGVEVADHSVLLTDFVNWQQLSTGNFTTTTNTASIKIGGFAHLTTCTWDNLNALTFDDFYLNPAVPVGPDPSSISDIKAAGEDTPVAVEAAIVSAAFDGFFYIENDIRSAGIKVVGTAAVGTKVNVEGIVKTVDGEKQITDALVGLADGTGNILALGMNNRSTTGSQLSATGLLVRVWGSVVDPGGNVFSITDGSNSGLKVYGPAGFTSSAGYVVVTGALGAEMSGGNIIPVIHAVSVN